MAAEIFNYINEQFFLYFTLTAFILACFRGCLLRIPYATVLSTLISTCGLIIGLATLYDATSILERLAHDLLRKNYLLLNDLKVGYIFVALFIIIIIIFNLVIGFVATDQSSYRAVESPNQRRRSCCPVTCLKSSTAVCLLQTFLAFNYIIYYLLLLMTIISFIGLYTSYIATTLCNEAPAINLAVDAHSKIPTEDDKLLDLRQFAPIINLPSNETHLLYFKGQRFQAFCIDFVQKLNFHILLCTIGFLLATAGFVNYLINFSVNSAKLSTKQKFTELMWLNSEMSPFDAKY